MTGHEVDWNMNLSLGQFGLKVQSAQSGQPNVKDQAAGDSGSLLSSISGAEANTSTFKPIDSKRLVSALRTDASSSITRTIDSLALADPGDDFGRSVTTHPPDARAARIETLHPGVSSFAAFGRCAFGIGQPRRNSPWQNGYCERAIGSVRRECLDHVVVFGERHLHHLLRSYATYYNSARTHLSVNKDAPSPRTVHAVGRILPTPFLGGLHHLYVRV